MTVFTSMSPLPDFAHVHASSKHRVAAVRGTGRLWIGGSRGRSREELGSTTGRLVAPRRLPCPGLHPPWLRHDLAEVGFSPSSVLRASQKCRSPPCSLLHKPDAIDWLPRSRNDPDLRSVVFNPVTSPPLFTYHWLIASCLSCPTCCTLLVGSRPDYVWPPRRSADRGFPCVLTATPREAAGASLNPWTVHVRILPLLLVSSTPWSDHL